MRHEILSQMTKREEGILSHNLYSYFFFVLLLTSCASKTNYPKHWWTPISSEGAPEWEILPQAAQENKNEVILSKRNELGILSNFAATAFWYQKKRYASIEGFWQMMKYPDPELKDDPRAKAIYPFTRDQVANMTGFEAKAAGDLASKIMQDLNINWVSFEGEKMTYCSISPGQHYFLIREAMIKKYRYNPEVQRILKATGSLKLLPDHYSGSCQAPEWKYHQLWMDIREEIFRSEFSRFMAPNMLPLF
jgi:predicted NAD-dependent protein-ADP-ribosyltransferase YbiA (DUF1768 family)